MKSKVLLRIAAVIMLLHGVGYATSVFTWQKGGLPTEVVQKMQERQFNYMYKDGSTMANLYSGTSFFGVILVLLIAVLLWTFSTWKDKMAVRLLWIVATAIILLAVDEIIYLFPIAVAHSAISLALVFVAIYQIKKGSRQL